MPSNNKTLGPQIARYRSRPFFGRGFQILLILGTLAVLAPLAYGYTRAQYAYAKYGPVAAQFWSRPWYLLAGLAAIVFLLLLVVGLLRAQRFVDIHKYGLRMRLSRRQQFTWTDLGGVATGAVQTRILGVPLNTRYQAELYPVKSAPLRLDQSLEKLPELLTRIKANLYPRLLPDMRQGFQDGKTLYFGPIAVQKHELRLEEMDHQPRIIPWSQVGSITVQAGMLVIETENDETTRLPVARVPNIELLLQIIQSGVNV